MLRLSIATAQRQLLVKTNFHSFTLAHYNKNTFPRTLLQQQYQHQQVRFKRRDGNKAFTRERKPTKKQRKRHHRELQAKQEAAEKRSPPGSKARGRKEYVQSVVDDYLKPRKDDDDANEEDEYDKHDALLEDIIGNTSFLTSQPSPEPVYLGHKHEKFHLEAKKQMEQLASSADVPSDHTISLALRSFRDRHGTKQKPCGIVSALAYLMQDLGVPVAAWGERTFTTLLTCARTPAEGRRILALMQQSQFPVSAYSWSIMVDIHAKVGDYQGCHQVMQEMLAQGVTPTLPAYTSFLAATFKVCNDGRVSHSVRAEAAKIAWEKWQEMRTVGVDPDVMAYGAMLRMCAAQGHPEQALNLLEEMQQMEVKPTTLCFSSALRAVARSHATAIRYERGFSRRNKRREMLTQHHGKMALSIVRMAESAEVNQDTGFIAALIQCAAAAGDAATAKAIYVASQIRQLDQLRTIGSDSHLARLRGETVDVENGLHITDGGVAQSLVETGNAVQPQVRRKQRKSQFGEREYGKDSRVLSAILHACAQSVNMNSIGTIWQGRENDGYLCENSLRLIVARKLPRYTDTSIPGQTITDDLTVEEDYKDEDYRAGKRRRRKFSGVDVSDAGTSSIDELDDDFARMFLNEDGRRKLEYQRTTPEDIWRWKYGSEPQSEILLERSAAKSLPASSGDPSSLREMSFDYESMRWSSRPKSASSTVPVLEASYASTGSDDLQNEDANDMFFDNEVMRWKARTKMESTDAPTFVVTTDDTGSYGSEHGEEMYFDYDDMRWNTRPMTSTRDDSIVDPSPKSEGVELSSIPVEQEEHLERMKMVFDADTMRWKTVPDDEGGDESALTDYEKLALSVRLNEPSTDQSASDLVDKADFSEFYAELMSELAQSGESSEGVGEDEARELFFAMRDEFNQFMNVGSEESVEKLGVESNSDAFRKKRDDRLNTVTVDRATTLTPIAPSNNAVSSDSSEMSKWATQQKSTPVDARPSGRATVTIDPAVFYSPEDDSSSLSNRLVLPEGMKVLDGAFTETVEVVDDDAAAQDMREIGELRELLPAFSDRRLRKILRTFEKSLGTPSLLDLTLVVREQMPDYLTATWLKQMSALTARYVVQAASRDKLVDIHMLNAVLELETQSGSIDRAVEFYETEFSRQGSTPNDYSNRLVLQMFLANNRVSRALAFKDSLVEDGTKVDIPSYGSLVDYCGRHGQLGSALLLLKECLAAHGSPPGQASLEHVRRLCRQAGVEDKITALAGPDPIEWLREGESRRKRETSKRGRRDVMLARNVALQA